MPMQGPTPSLSNANNLTLTDVSFFLLNSTSYEILSHTKYFVCIIIPPQNMHCISSCDYTVKLLCIHVATEHFLAL